MSIEKPKSQDDSLDRKTLFVRAIPFDVTNDQLSDFFSEFAPVRHAVIVNDKENKSRGFGFVSFTSDDDTLIALQKAKTSKLNNRLLRVDVAKRRDRKNINNNDDNDNDNDNEVKKIKKDIVAPEKVALERSARLIVRNLPWSIKNPDELAKCFRMYGTVKESKIPKKKDGKMCGFGFITMSKHSNAEKAVKESVGMKINGREVAVDFAVNKQHWSQIKTDLESKVEEIENSKVDESEEEAEKEAAEEDEEDLIDDNDVNMVSPNEDNEDEEEDDDGNDDDDNDDNNNSITEEDAKLLALEETEEVNNKNKKNRQERYCVFVRNLPYDVTEEGLQKHFEKLGEVKYALPVVDKETGLPRGTAFIAFKSNAPYEECLLNAPSVSSNSVLLPDDVSPFYVYEGRIMQIAPALDRDSAARMAEKSANNRKEMLGRVPKESDKRNLYLLNEGRIGPNSKLASLLSQGDLDVRERSFNLRVDQLKKNPGLHLSMTRLAIRNLPRAMNDKSLKQLGRKAIVEFATEVKQSLRQPLSKEEIDRSTKQKHFVLEKLGITDADEKKKVSKHGVVTQAKVINEVKGSGEHGRSRGYGFLEFRDHKHALMALRWLNAHEVTKAEICSGLTEEQKKMAEKDKSINKRRLVAEFAIENASVVKRRYEQIVRSRNEGTDGSNKRKRDFEKDDSDKKNGKSFDKNNKRQKTSNFKGKRGNLNKGPNVGKSNQSKDDKKTNDSDVAENVKRIIGKKRRQKKQGKN
ncbi:RNA recognition motif-containing protein [Pichia californica]|uniref:RNA recognition motif-containing protein n=1 Tax=Pichia californica TaxID=460514 RepID=A0A9P6WGZ4_9ASCO|nr:RNA recognition motif-containing protein [[Candida] californica]KAG0686549.1 RNA recognition motif-containing protein [[Candida] californica]